MNATQNGASVSPLRCGLAAAIALVALAACQPARLDGQPNPDSPYFRPPTGSMLEIREPVEVSARRDRVYFQDGRRRAWHEVNEYGAYCALMLTARADEVRTIESGAYVVEAVSRRYLFGLARREMPVRAVPVAERDRGREDYRVLALVLALSGPDPRLEALVCARWGLPQGLAKVTLRDIRATLGTGFELRLAPG